MIHNVERKYNPNDLENKIQETWERTKAYDRTKDLCKGGISYYFIDGPPYTTGFIHLGTAWNKILKDAILRFRRMEKYNVRDQPGFDMHGLPIEVQVEKSLNITHKKQIEDMGIDTFVERCRKFALDYRDKMVGQFKALGVWMDWKRPYLTITHEYMESEWWTIKQAFLKRLLIQSKQVLTWCPRCQTALAEAEVEYWDETDPSVYVKFPIVGKHNESLIIWTTTPWTLVSNLAVAVNPEFTYARVKAWVGGREETFILLNDAVEKVMELAGFGNYEVVETFGGSQLVRLKYIQPFLYELHSQQTMEGEWLHKVLLSDTVTEEYTGIVHIAPGHGPEDFEIGKQHDLPPFCPVGEDGKYDGDAGKFSGIDVKNADKIVVQELKRNRLMLYDSQITHRYGHCWRCKTPILYRATDQWFLKVTAIKDKMLREIESITWMPEWAGSSRMKDWVMNAKDWCISRQRYWGTPLPIWKCECGNVIVIGSTGAMATAKNYKRGMDLHRPWIDAITFPCPKCKKQMKRVPDVIDVWFDSAVCAWAELGYPKDRTRYEKWWPCKWITEGHDQTRGWFYSQLGAGVVAFGEIPYKSVLMHGWTLDHEGKRMSKSMGNVIDPFEVIQKYGVDSLRLYLLKCTPWEDIAFSWDEVKNAHRTLNILWNAYVFATTYMSLDHFTPDKVQLRPLKKHLRPEDKWLLSRTENIKREFKDHMENYNIHLASRALERFILEDISRWYIKLIRDLIWVEGDDKKKLAAYKVLHKALITTVELLSSICPHISEEIYQNLDGKLNTVSMCDFPKLEETLIDYEVETYMNISREIVDTVAGLRQMAKIKLRWPINRIVVVAKTAEAENAVNNLRHLLLRQTNSKDIELVAVGEEWEGMELSVQPNMDVIGPVFRQWASKIEALLQYKSARRIKEGIEAGEYVLGIEGQQVKIMPNMVSFSEKLPEGMIQGDSSSAIVYFDTELTEELRSEGYSKEVIRRIQEMRKEMNLQVEDYIETNIFMGDKLFELLEEQKDFISGETRSKILEFTQEEPKEGYIVEWNAEGENFTIGIVPIVFEDEAEAAPAAPAKPPEVEEEVTEKTCPYCHSDLQYINEYKAWYCYSCERYPELEEKKAEAEAMEKAKFEKECSVCGVNIPSDEDMCEKCKATTSREEAAVAPSGPTVEADEKAPGEEVVPPVEAAIPPLVAETAPDVTSEEIKPEPTKAEDSDVRTIKTKKDEISINDLKEGATHLIIGGGSEAPYLLLEDAIERDYPAICVTRDFPKKLREKYDLKDIKMYWLSNIGKVDAIRPKNLEKLSLTMEQFLSKGKNCVILLHGIEYLITNNNFITVLRLVQSLRDQIAVTNSMLIIPVDPNVLEKNELNLLEREIDVILSPV